ncbi:hypothetical protein D3C80_2056860 [compost metagenome]
MKQVEKVVHLLTEVHNHTRVWSNCGHTPSELRGLTATPVIYGKVVKSVTVNKIGRNEPCPCGSGLKYKKCCGK